MIVNMLLRGRSLRHFEQIKDKPDVVFLVNDMHREIDHVDGLRDYLSNKEINLVQSLVPGSEQGFLKTDFFNKFNVTRVVRPYLIGTRVDGLSIPIKSTFLDKNHIPFMSIGTKYTYEYPSTGIAAIGEAVLTHRPSVLNIIGLDFYDNLRQGKSSYLVPQFQGRDFNVDFSDKEQKGDSLQEDLLSDWQYQMQNSLCDFAEYIPSMKVNLWTLCTELIDRLKTQENITIKEVE